MQINNSALNLCAVGQTTAADLTKAAGRAPHQQEGGDSVQLSNFAAQLSADPLRIAQLQAAYQSGSYRASGSQVANSIIQDALPPDSGG